MNSAYKYWQDPSNTEYERQIWHAEKEAEKEANKWVRSYDALEYLLHENDEGLPVVFPLLRQLALVGILVTAHVDGQLKAVGVQIAEVIYACQRGVKKYKGVKYNRT